MASEKKGSDLGFIIFLIFAVIVMIPLAVGIDSFDQFILIGKIVLISAVVIVIALIAILVAIFIRKRIKIKEKSKLTEGEKDYFNLKEKDNKTIPIYPKEPIIVNPEHKQLEAIEVDNTQADLEKIKIELQKINKKFDL